MSKLALALAFALSACGDPPPAATPTAGEPVTLPVAGSAVTTPPTTPDVGAPTEALTVEKLTAARDSVHAFQPWAEAEPLLKVAVGEPQVTEGETRRWYAKDGETCQILTVTKLGDSVGASGLEPGACPAT
jgi:hypothetical protein